MVDVVVVVVGIDVVVVVVVLMVAKNENRDIQSNFRFLGYKNDAQNTAFICKKIRRLFSHCFFSEMFEFISLAKAAYKYSVSIILIKFGPIEPSNHVC